MKIAFIGLGNMGAPMALNLAQAGHEVTGFDTAARPEGLTLADSAADVLAAIDRDAAAMGVLDRVRHQVLRDAAQEGGVAVHHRRGGDKAEPQPPRLGHGRIFDGQAAEQRPQFHGLAVELDPLAVQARDVQNGVHQLFHRFEGTRKPVGQFALLVVQLRVGKRGQKQPRGRKRLQQVMAGRAQEAGLGPVRLLGRGARHGQFAVALRQVGQRLFQIAGAGADLVLQHGGALKLGIAGAAVLGQVLDMADQRLGDAHQLFMAPIRAVAGRHHPFDIGRQIRARAGHGVPSGP